MADQILQAMFKLQEVRRDDVIDESDVKLLREAAGLINELILSVGQVLDEDQSVDILVNEDNDIIIPDNILMSLARNHEIATRASILEDELKDNLLKNMVHYDIKKFENDVFTASRVEAGVSNRFSTAKFKKDHPELYEEYVTQSERKAYVRISYKN